MPLNIHNDWVYNNSSSLWVTLGYSEWVFTGWMPFLSPNQHRLSTKQNSQHWLQPQHWLRRDETLPQGSNYNNRLAKWLYKKALGTVHTSPHEQNHFQNLINSYPSTIYLFPRFHKSSVVAEMGDRGHNRDWPKKGGCCAPFGGAQHLTQCRLGWGLLPYQVVSWYIQPFGHNRYQPKIGGLCPFLGGRCVPI